MRLLPTLSIACAQATLCCATEAGPLTPPGPVAPTPGPNPPAVVNQTNTPGDADFAYIIDQPGSYRLDRNVFVASGKAGIHINAPNVTLDMAGFTLFGTGDPVTAMDGIFVNVPGSGASTVVIANGVLTDWSDGVDIFSSPNNPASHVIIQNVTSSGNINSGVDINPDITGVRLREVHTSGNGFAGVLGPTASVNAIGVHANGNGTVGMVVGPKSSVENSRTDKNGGTGLTIRSGSVNNHDAHNNQGSGIIATSPNGGATIDNSRTHENDLAGISGDKQTKVRNSKADGNGRAGICAGDVEGCETNGNDAGVETPEGGRIRQSRADDNNSYGFNVGPRSRVDACVATGNPVGARLGDGSVISDSVVSQSLSTGVEALGYVSILRNHLLMNGDAVTILGVSDGGEGGVLVDGNRFEQNSPRAIVILGDGNLIHRNVFRGNGQDILDFGSLNKIAPIQCDHLTAGPWDNWEM